MEDGICAALFALAIFAIGYGGAFLAITFAYGLFAMTGQHEFSVITTLWFAYKCAETYYYAEN